MRRLTGLDGLRGVAAVAVAIYHADISLGLRGALTVKGPLAVDFFFCLSGFVLAYVHDAQLVAGKISGVSFLIKRYRRFLPMLAIGTIFGIAVLSNIGFHDDRSFLNGTDGLKYSALIIILSIFAFPMLIHCGPVFLIGTFWSLFMELLANWLYGAFGKNLSNLFLSCLTLLSFLIFLVAIIHNGSTHIVMESWQSFPFAIARTFSSFFVGVCTFRLWKSSRRLQALDVSYGWLVAAILFPMLIPGSRPIIQVPLDVFYCSVGFPLIIIMGANIADNVPGWCLPLGRLSFPLYAIHLQILSFLLIVIHPASVFEKFVFGVMFGLVMIPISLAVATYLEEPALRWLSKKSVRTVPAIPPDNLTHSVAGG